MAQRRKIGIVYTYNDKWIGGTYYILNLISALNSLANEMQPIVLLYVTSYKDYENVKEQTSYKYLVYKNSKTYFDNFLFRGINFLSRKLFKSNLIPKQASADISFCFPNPSGDFFKNVKRKIYWVPDLQEKHFPDFFSKEEVAARNQFYKNLVLNNEEVVFSSEASKKDFFDLFPDAKIKSHIIKFAVTHPSLNNIDRNDLLLKYNLPQNYFICPNQFWVHKNHKVVIEAVNNLQSQGINVSVVFTGKEHDHRYPDYANNLKSEVVNAGYPDAFHFLGFIDRIDQLMLMKTSIAVIQPSFSEGWSTVIEDAIALGKWVVCSNIPANKEQILSNVSFFNPYAANELSEIIKERINIPLKVDEANYQNRIQKFALDFIDLL